MHGLRFPPEGTTVKSESQKMPSESLVNTRRVKISTVAPSAKLYPCKLRPVIEVFSPRDGSTSMLKLASETAVSD